MAIIDNKSMKLFKFQIYEDVPSLGRAKKKAFAPPWILGISVAVVIFKIWASLWSKLQHQ